MDFTIGWGHIIAIATFVIGGWMAMRNTMQTQLNEINVSIARLETLVGELGEDVRKHNGVVERTIILEHNIKTVWNRYDDLKEHMREIERQVKKEV